MKRFVFISAFGMAGLAAMYAQSPGTPDRASQAQASPTQTGQAHIATPSQKPGDATTYKRDDDANRKKKKPNPTENPGAKEPIRNPANGPVGTPTNPK